MRAPLSAAWLQGLRARRAGADRAHNTPTLCGPACSAVTAPGRQIAAARVRDRRYTTPPGLDEVRRRPRGRRTVRRRPTIRGTWECPTAPGRIRRTQLPESTARTA